MKGNFPANTMFVPNLTIKIKISPVLLYFIPEYILTALIVLLMHFLRKKKQDKVL